VDELTPAEREAFPPPAPHPGSTPATRTWGVHPAAFLGCAVAAFGGLAWALLTPAPEDRLVAWALVVFAALAGVACLLMRRRLTVEPHRLVVRGPGGVRTHPWSSVAGVQLVRRSRLGVGSTTLEIDLADGGLIILGRFDLGEDPADVAEVVRATWLAGRR
jgi:hypothetical protein